jgi:hypothetical protein
MMLDYGVMRLMMKWGKEIPPPPAPSFDDDDNDATTKKTNYLLINDSLMAIRPFTGLLDNITHHPPPRNGQNDTEISFVSLSYWPTNRVERIPSGLKVQHEHSIQEGYKYFMTKYA